MILRCSLLCITFIAWALSWFLGLVPLVSLAGEAEVPQVIIRDVRGSEGRSSAASHTRVPVAEYESRIVTLPEVLSEQAGLHMTRYGGLEESTSVSIRGSDADEVMVLLDGIPLNSARGGGVDLTPFHIGNFETIDVYRGGSPIQTGFFPSAGLIQLKSKKLRKGAYRDFSFSAGSFETVKGHVSYSQTLDRFGFNLSNSVLSSTGNFSFLDDNGTPVNTADDQVVERQNNQSLTIHPFVKLSYDFDSRTNIEAVSHVIRKESGVPGLSSNQSRTANLDRTEWLASLRLKRMGFFQNKASFEHLLFLRLLKDQFSDLNGEIGLGGVQDNDDDTSLLGTKVAIEAYPDSHQVLSAFFIYQFERFQPENFLAAPSQGGVSKRHRWSLGIGDEMDLLDHRLLVNPLISLENIHNRINNDDPSFLTPATFSNSRSNHEVSATLGVKWIPFSFVSASSHIGRSFRFPTFPELFGDRGGVVGNQFLDPQKSLNWDLGFELNFLQKISWLDPLLLSITYFDRRLTELIQFQQNTGFARAENIGKAHIQGLEVQARMGFFSHFLLTTGYTFQWAKDEGNNSGNFLTGRPQNEVTAKAEGWISWARTFVTLNWIDSNFLDPLNTRVTRDRVILNTGISFQLRKGLTLMFEGKNLINDQIVDVVGFPLPGRSFYGGVRFAL